MNNLEIEYKYDAHNITLHDFQESAAIRKPIKSFDVSGYDHFYSCVKKPDSFCRHRVGPDVNQLTFKRKTESGNNFIRTEHNLDLNKSSPNTTVTNILKELGYEKTGSIFKTCFIHVFEDHVLSYYVCYDSNLKEVGRFLEIEASESFPWRDEEHALRCIAYVEADILMPEAKTRRISASLFEMFGRNLLK